MWSDEFESILRRHLVMPAERTLDPDESLADLGLDSMGTVSALVDLEQAFSVTFTDEQLVPETFQTPRTLWKVLSTLSGLSVQTR